MSIYNSILLKYVQITIILLSNKEENSVRENFPENQTNHIIPASKQ